MGWIAGCGWVGWAGSNNVLICGALEEPKELAMGEKTDVLPLTPEVPSLFNSHFLHGIHSDSASYLKKPIYGPLTFRLVEVDGPDCISAVSKGAYRRSRSTRYLSRSSNLQVTFAVLQLSHTSCPG